MNGTHFSQLELLERIHDFVVAGVSDELTSDQWTRFEQLLWENEDACRLYFEYIEESDFLQTILESMPDDEAISSDVLFLEPNSTVSPAAAFFPTTLHNSFVYLSSGWPVAYLIATVLLGVGIWIGAITPASHPTQVARDSSSIRDESSSVSENKTVGRITGMIDCVWKEPSGSRTSSGVVTGRKYSLVSGLLEITYGTGAKVILQGPVEYQIESKNGGYLAAGKLTGKVRHGVANGLRIRTPTAVVTDLGTEFGVEVDKERQTKLHVFRGKVEMRLSGKEADGVGRSIIVCTNESAETRHVPDEKGVSTILFNRNGMKAGTFVRQLIPVVKTLDLRDIVAGGDGRLQRSQANRSASGRTGDVVLPLGSLSAYQPSRFPSMNRLVDRVLYPDGSEDLIRLDSAGHTFAGFPKLGGSSRGCLWATRQGAGEAGAADTGLLGICPNAGITFDLGEMRRRFHVRASRFRATVFSAAPPEDTTLFFDDFQSDAAGTMPRDKNKILLPVIDDQDVGGRWAIAPAAGTLLQVWNNADPGHPKDDEGRNHYAAVARDRVSRDGDLRATGWTNGVTDNRPVELSFSLWVDSTSASYAAVDGFSDAAFGGRSISAYFHPSGEVSYYDGSNYIDTGITYETNRWQRVCIKADMANRTFSLTVGASSVDNLRWNDPTNVINGVVFSNANEPPGRFFIDNVKLTYAPGLSESQRRGFGRSGAGDIWVFLDGQLKLQKRKLQSQDEAVPVDIAIGPDGRFLTLVSTNDDKTNGAGWVVWRTPVLEMLPIDEESP